MISAVRCALYAVRCALCAVCAARCALCAVCAVRCTLCAVRCALYAVRCTLCAVRCALYAVRCAVCGVRCAVCGVRCAVCGVRCALCGVCTLCFNPVSRNVQCSELQIDRRLTRVRNVFEQVSWICSKVLIGVSELSPFSEAQEDVTKSRKEFLQLARIRSTTLALVQVESSSYAKLVQLIAEHVEAIIQCRQIEIGSNLATNSTLDSSSACASVLLISRFEIMSTTLAPSPSTTASPVPRETKASDQHTPLTEPSQASPASLPL